MNNLKIQKAIIEKQGQTQATSSQSNTSNRTPYPWISRRQTKMKMKTKTITCMLNQYGKLILKTQHVNKLSMVYLGYAEKLLELIVKLVEPIYLTLFRRPLSL